MSIIQVLDQHTINKIAAGEVIERPASVVKELVENSIDSGASSITIEIKEGGIGFIRITDNGSGIEKDDIKRAFLRHATSKIRKAEDLLYVSSLGFRGEALSSIAAVSQVELITKTSSDLTGIRYQIEGGKEKNHEEIGCPEGTTFIVRNLFFNTPARRKFLKTSTTEGSHIGELINRLALSHPNISFQFIVNGQNKLYSSGNDNLKDIIYHIYGNQISKNLISVESKNNLIQITGFIGKPYVSRGNRNYENYFINNRYIKSSVISKAIEEAYKTFIMVHKYPFCSLNFTIPSELIDVNVHPTKMELRFKNAEEIYDLVYSTIRNALSHKELIPKVPIDEKKETKGSTLVNRNHIEPFESKRITHIKESFNVLEETKDISKVSDNVVNYKLSNTNLPNININNESKNRTVNALQGMVENKTTKKISLEPEKDLTIKGQIKKEQENIPEQMSLFNDKLLSKESLPAQHIIGQLFKTYWLIEYDNNLFIMDQHAAHEKVLYEKLVKTMETNEVYQQQLEPPVIVTLSMNEANILLMFRQHFEKIGFTIEEFGGNEYCIRAVPNNLFGFSNQDFFIEILDSISNDVARITPDTITDKIATMACKAAVKGNHLMNQSEIEALLKELMLLDNPYTCPHGRPTIISMSKTEIEKKFKRIQG